MIVIDKNTVVVFSSSELKDSLANNNGYSYIYLGADISLESGIVISNAKSLVVIDGTYNGIRYKFYDRKSTNTGDTISINSAVTAKVIVKNMDIYGYNYYGIIYVAEASAYKDVVVEYNNISYIGTQISFNPVGLTRFVDSIITIQDSYSVGNEVCECNRIEIGGATTITHKSTANSAFWFRNTNPSLKILENANVNFSSISRELIYGVSNLEFLIAKNATFQVTTYNGMGYGSYGTGTTTLEEGAKFILKQTNRNGGNATWYSYGKITLNYNSVLNIISNYANISSSNYNIYFSGSSSGLVLNNPYQVVLYNSVANVIYSSTRIPFSFNFSRINMFSSAISLTDDITQETLPTYSWYKENSIAFVEGTFTSNSVLVSSHNFTDSELSLLPSFDNFIFSTKKIVSVGDFLFSLEALTDKDTIMRGKTLPNASILIQYNSVSVVVKALEDGSFEYSYLEPLSIGTEISFNAKMADEAIYHTKIITIVYSGELVLFSVPSKVDFKLLPISNNPLLCPRDSEFEIVVVDSRVTSSNWKLYAYIEHELEAENGEVLEDSLVFVSDGNLTVLSATPTLIYTGDSNGGSTKTTNVTFNDDEGILLQIKKYLVSNLEYKTIIIWKLEE